MAITVNQRLRDAAGYASPIWERSVCIANSLLRKCRAVISGGATARSLALLAQWLSPEQRAQFRATKSFDVAGSHTGKRYRIRYGKNTNIFELDEAGFPVMGWCFVPEGRLAVGDILLTQKIALETDECAALLVARRFRVNIPRQRHGPTV